MVLPSMIAPKCTHCKNPTDESNAIAAEDEYGDTIVTYAILFAWRDILP